jgi:hypothetical protein
MPYCYRTRFVSVFYGNRIKFHIVFIAFKVNCHEIYLFIYLFFISSVSSVLEVFMNFFEYSLSFRYT